MSVLQAVVLGLLQGATEFIPVSSSGHLVLIPWLLGWEDPSLLFDVIVHLGTLCAVVVYFWADIVALLVGAWQSLRDRNLDTPAKRLPWLLVLATIPAAVLGYLIEDYVEQLFGAPQTVAILLLVTGGLLVASETLGRRVRSLEQIRISDAAAVGLAQAVAIIPGISRSGATMAMGLGRGLQRDAAARFSFLMSLPIIAGAAGSQILSAAETGFETLNPAPLAAGFVVAALSGYLAIRFLLNYVRAHSLRPFAYYCWIAGLILLVLTFVR
ncbi:MAG: undecaprenyl-diphosphatase UppP [Anaerolineae bacterium]